MGECRLSHILLHTTVPTCIWKTIAILVPKGLIGVVMVSEIRTLPSAVAVYAA